MVVDRSAAIIQHYIRPGSVIISDEWRAYSTLSSLGYAHQTVNHSNNFVDPSTGAYTKLIPLRPLPNLFIGKLVEEILLWRGPIKIT